jgi:hypothetical protein
MWKDLTACNHNKKMLKRVDIISLALTFYVATSQRHNAFMVFYAPFLKMLIT